MSGVFGKHINVYQNIIFSGFTYIFCKGAFVKLFTSFENYKTAENSSFYTDSNSPCCSEASQLY